eukprot:1129079-Pleurochrysis_carterae.AAC.5
MMRWRLRSACWRLLIFAFNGVRFRPVALGESESRKNLHMFLLHGMSLGKKVCPKSRVWLLLLLTLSRNPPQYYPPPAAQCLLAEDVTPAYT